MTDSQLIYIPLLNGNQSVSIDINNLPTDVSDVIDFLTLEFAHPAIWIYLALQYYKHGDNVSFLAICQQLASTEAQEAYNGVQYKPYKVQVFYILAQYFIEQGEYTAANDYINVGSTIDIKNSMLWLCKALIQLYQHNSMVQCNKNIDIAIQSDNTNKISERNVLLFVMKAVMYYNEKNYKKALEVFYQVLQLNPAIPAAVRHGIAHCYLQLNLYDHAKYVYQRILELDGTNINAIVGYTILEHSKDIQLVSNKIIELYSNDPTNTTLSLYVIQYLFSAEQYDTVDKLCKQLLSTNINNNNQLKSELNYYMGQVAHIRNNDILAYNYYNTAYELNKHNNSLLYHLAQLCTKQTNYNKSNEYLAQIQHKATATSYIYNYLYAYNYYKLNKHTDAYKYCQIIYNNVKQHRIDYLLLYFFVSIFVNLQTADTVAHEIIQYYTKHNLELPVQICCNYAVVLYKLDKFSDAIQYYLQALKQSKLENIDDITSVKLDITIGNITIVYNMCLCLEQYAFDNNTAILQYVESLYKQMIAQYETYNIAYLKLGKLYEYYKAHNIDNIKAEQILEQYNKSFSIQPNDITSLICVGNYHMSQHELDAALKRFESLKTKGGKLHDVYSTLQYCTIYLNIIHKQIVKNTITNKQIRLMEDTKISDCIKKCEKYYTMILEADSHNVYACIGIAIILAIQGYYDVAKNMLLELKTIPECSELLVISLNLGHIYYYLQTYNLAVNYYLHIYNTMYGEHKNDKLVKQQNFRLNEVTIVLLIANCYFQLNTFDTAIELIEHTLTKYTDNIQLLYNLSLIYEQKSINILQRLQTEKLNYTEIESAYTILKQSESIYAKLQTTQDKLIQQKATIHYKFVQQSLQKAEPMIQHSKQAYEAQLQAEQYAIQQRLETEEKLKQAELERIRQLEEQKQKEQELALAKKAELEKFNNTWSEQQAIAAMSKKKGKDDIDSDTEQKDIVVEATETTKKKSKKQSSKRKSKKNRDADEEDNQSQNSADVTVQPEDIAAAPSVLQPSPEPVDDTTNDIIDDTTALRNERGEKSGAAVLLERRRQAEQATTQQTSATKVKRGRLNRHTEIDDNNDENKESETSDIAPSKTKSKRRKITSDDDDEADTAAGVADNDTVMDTTEADVTQADE